MRPALAVFAALCVWFAGSPLESLACLAHYCSPEQIVTESPLIFVGTVESVKELLVEDKILGGDTPMMATVKIGRILKGSCRDASVNVMSGPVASCSLAPSHYKFKKGERAIFCLSTFPKDGKSGLYTSGRLLRVSDTELIESIMNRALVQKQAYLGRIQKESPKIYAEAEELCRRLSRAASVWPEPEYTFDDKAGTSRKNLAYEKIRDTLIAEVRTTNVRILRTAAAMDWMSDDPKAFSKQLLWKDVMLNAQHEKAFCKDERDELRLILRQAGVEKDLVEEYLASVPDTALETGCGFPLRAPDPWNRAELSGDVLTTDFILRYNCFDRGYMFPSYGMGFDKLAALKPDRLKDIIPAMLGSRDEKVSLVAHRAIERMPGTAFVDVLLDAARGGNRYALQALVVENSEKQTEQRYKALLEYSGAEPDFWYVLSRNSCFEQAAVERALQLLESGPDLSQYGDSREDSLAKYQKQAVYAYLKAAMASMGGGEASESEMTPAQYRAWFAGKRQVKK